MIDPGLHVPNYNCDRISEAETTCHLSRRVFAKPQKNNNAMQCRRLVQGAFG